MVIVPADVETVSRAIRDLVSRARDSPERVRTWAIIGDMGTRDGLTENERVVEHDRVGRLAVRLAVDKTLCVGESRAVRALHQGAVMEGSWGDEARLVATVDDAAATLDTDAGALRPTTWCLSRAPIRRWPIWRVRVHELRDWGDDETGTRRATSDRRAN